MSSWRQNLLLSLIPFTPQRITIIKLKVKLSNQGIDLSTRMLQRDLQSLYDQGCFGLEKDTRTKPYAWSISKEWRGNSPILSTELAQHYLLLEQLLPQNIPIDIKQAIHAKADIALQRLNGIKPEWLNLKSNRTIKVNVDSKVVEQIEHAIKHNRLVSAEIYRVLYDQAHWLAFPELSIYGLEEDNGILMAQFMVGTLHDKCYQMPVYRIRNVKVLQKIRREPNLEQLSSLRSAINKGKRQESINLIIKVPSQSSLNQGFVQFGELIEQKRLDAKTSLLTFNAQDTEQLTNELFRASHWLEVIEPQAVRSRIIKKLNEASNTYNL
ncbi:MULTISPECIES: WYL domain-containing protein [unclassified Pseudoalteromonas]|uniref:WYL domain-containing protein n=1 Tax=unclassified Pseudoalteromonas TaxID=194690 RepID=UPI001EFD2924|nr:MULTISPECIES: WYL domain-containing protein [unclassified Pseudoalteromonas]MCG9709459.1 WYL domain-containing protein [Pseudoalteromonas sp. Isolate3]